MIRLLANPYIFGGALLALVGTHGAMFLYGMGYQRAMYKSASSERQRAQVEGEIALSKDVEQLKQEIGKDESDGFDIIFNAIERLH